MVSTRTATPPFAALTRRIRQATVPTWALVSPSAQVPSLGYWSRTYADSIPDPYRRLLAHDGLMTPRLEHLYGGRASVRVVEECKQPDRYARKSVLCVGNTNRVVAFAVIRIEACRCAVRLWDLLLEGSIPVGTILRENGVRSRVHVDALVEVTPGAELLSHFGMTASRTLHGRFATHYWDEDPAVQVLEIVPPCSRSLNHARADN